MTDRIVINGGVKIQYRIKEGRGTPLVFLHGGGGSLSAWERMLPFFKKSGCPLITVDLRGFGLSDRPEEIDNYSMENHAQDINRILISEHINKSIIIGHCFGSMVAVTFGNLYPRKTERLVLINTGFGLPWFIDNIVLYYPLKILSLIIVLFIKASHKGGRVDYTQFNFLPDIELKRLKLDIKATGVGSLSRQFLALCKWKGKKYFQNLKVPVLVLSGKHDSIYPIKITNQVMNQIPHAKREYLEGNHILIINNPGETYGRIAEYLNTRL